MRTAQVQVTGVTTSPWLPLDPYTSAINDGLYLEPGAGATVSVEITPDNVLDPSVTPVAYPCNIAALTGATAKASGGLAQAARAVRLNQTVGGSTSVLKVVVKGII